MSDATVQEGSLATKDIADLVQQLYEQRWTGLVTLSHRGLVRRIAVQAGRLVFAQSSNPDDRLGERLLRLGRISLQQYLEAGRSVAPGRRLGGIFVEMGVLSPKDLMRAVTEQAEDVIYGSFQWTEGRYRLQAGLDSAEAITLKMSTPDLIMEGLRRVESWTRIMRAVGGPEAEYVRSEDYERIIGEMTLSFERLTLLTGLHETRNVLQICEESTLPDLDVCKTLWAFKVVGAVWRVNAPAEQRELGDDDGLGAVLAEG